MARKISYEQQARLSVILALAGIVAALGAAYLLFLNYKPDSNWVLYSTRGLWFPSLGAALASSLLLSASGALTGFISAGQKKNTLSRVSWLGFFTGAGGLTLAMMAGVFFFFFRQALR